MHSIHQTYAFIRKHPLGRRHTLRAMRNWIGWQLYNRLSAGPYAVTLVGGSGVLVTPSMHGATGNLYCGLRDIKDIAIAQGSARGLPAGSRNLRTNALAVTGRDSDAAMRRKN